MNTDLVNLKYLLSRSDVEAALLYLEKSDLSPMKKHNCIEYIKKFWSSMSGDYESVYYEAGRIEAENSWAIRTVQNETRYKVLRDFLLEHPDLKKIYDYGASRCLYDIKLCNELGREWFCVDIDPKSVEEAKKINKIYSNHPERIQVSVVDKTCKNIEQYDCCICMEVLEHVLEPIKLLNELVSNVRVGGKFFITVPYGPIEYTMWKDSPTRSREHIREFNEQMLGELFGDKKDYQISKINYGMNKYLDMEMGCFAITFTKEENIVFSYEVDLGEKLKNVYDVELPGFEI